MYRQQTTSAVTTLCEGCLWRSWMGEPRESGRPSADLQGRIVRAGMELFGEAGFDATTVQQIAQRAGVSPVTVYRHVGTKAAIAFWPHEQETTLLRTLAGSTAPQPDVRRMVVAVLRRFAQELPVDRPQAARRLDLIEGSATLQQLATMTVRELEQALVEGITSARSAQACDLDCAVACSAGLGTYFHAAGFWYRSDQDTPWVDAVDRALLVLWPDLAAD